MGWEQSQLRALQSAERSMRLEASGHTADPQGLPQLANGDAETSEIATASLALTLSACPVTSEAAASSLSSLALRPVETTMAPMLATNVQLHARRIPENVELAAIDAKGHPPNSNNGRSIDHWLVCTDGGSDEKSSRKKIERQLCHLAHYWSGTWIAFATCTN